MNSNQKLLKKIADKDAKVGIIGLGYVGLPLLIRFAECGYQVIGFDIDEAKIDLLNSGQSYIKYIPHKVIERIQGAIEATTEFSRVSEVDAIILCLPTPLDVHREPDLSFVLSTVEGLVPYLREGQVLSLESTTFPGTTKEELVPRLADTGLVIGQDFFVIYSPEREDPGNKEFPAHTIPKICAGVSENCLEVGMTLYSSIVDKVVPVSSPAVAEMTKILENIHRAVNIGLVNELKIVADKMGIDIREVIDAAATKPFGFVPYYPGPGLGGHCIPIDPFYLTWKAKEYGVNTRFIELAGEVNSAMPRYVVDRLVHGLNKFSKSVKGSNILLVGIAYKKDVDDTRESPGVEIMQELINMGARVSYHDPFVPTIPEMRRYDVRLSSAELSQETVSAADAVVIVTDHSDVDYSLIRQHAQLVVDSRGVYRDQFAGLVRA